MNMKKIGVELYIALVTCLKRVTAAHRTVAGTRKMLENKLVTSAKGQGVITSAVEKTIM